MHYCYEYRRKTHEFIYLNIIDKEWMTIKVALTSSYINL